METFWFRIADSFTPETLPMARLADYLAEYARLLGEVRNVHLGPIVAGSVQLAAIADAPVVHKVRSRVSSIAMGNAPDDAMKAWQKLDDLLAEDNATGQLSDGRGAVILQFRGRERPVPQVFGPFTQDGFLDGEIVSIGGKDETIHVHIRDEGVVYTACQATKTLARELRHHLLGGYVRLQGTGRWLRHGDGNWELKAFRIKSFEPLKNDTLQHIVERLHAVNRGEWDEPDPISAVFDERGTDEEQARN